MTTVDVDLDGPAKHHPWLCSAPRRGCWATCLCGWVDRERFTTITGAHLAFGRHLLAAASAAAPTSTPRESR